MHKHADEHRISFSNDMLTSLLNPTAAYNTIQSIEPHSVHVSTQHHLVRWSPEQKRASRKTRAEVLLKNKNIATDINCDERVTENKAI